MSTFKTDNLLHEFGLTHALMPFIKRGIAIQRPVRSEPQPDAIIDLQEDVYVEVDMGSMNKSQIIGRMKKYDDQLVVWIAPTRKRMKWLFNLCDNDNSLFSTFCWCWHVWWDIERNTVSVRALK